MSIQDLGSIGELIAALATLGTLFYLALQIRANTRQMRGQAFVNLNDASRHIVSTLQDDPDLTEIVLKASDDWFSLTPEEQRLANFYWIDDTNYFELAFMLWQQGAIDEASYTVKERHLVTQLTSPGRRHWWDNIEHNVDPRFRVRVNSQLELADSEGRRSLSERYAMYAPRGNGAATGIEKPRQSPDSSPSNDG